LLSEIEEAVDGILRSRNVYRFIPNRVDRAFAQGVSTGINRYGGVDPVRMHPCYRDTWAAAMDHLLDDREVGDVPAADWRRLATKADRMAQVAAWLWAA
jgi:hypothetical protein